MFSQKKGLHFGSAPDFMIFVRKKEVLLKKKERDLQFKAITLENRIFVALIPTLVFT